MPLARAKTILCVSILWLGGEPSLAATGVSKLCRGNGVARIGAMTVENAKAPDGSLRAHWPGEFIAEKLFVEGSGRDLDFAVLAERMFHLVNIEHTGFISGWLTPEQRQSLGLGPLSIRAVVVQESSSPLGTAVAAKFAGRWENLPEYLKTQLADAWLISTWLGVDAFEPERWVLENDQVVIAQPFIRVQQGFEKGMDLRFARLPLLDRNGESVPPDELVKRVSPKAWELVRDTDARSLNTILGRDLKGVGSRSRMAILIRGKDLVEYFERLRG